MCEWYWPCLTYVLVVLHHPTFANECETTIWRPHATDAATQMEATHKRMYKLVLLRDCQLLDYSAQDMLHDSKDSSCGPTQVLSRDLPVVNEENHENPRSGHWYTGQDFNRESHEYEFKALTPCQPALAHKYGFNYDWESVNRSQMEVKQMSWM
jgi:hypothetical protein